MTPLSHDDPAELSDINVTPLVDVMLVLVVILLITVPTVWHAIAVDLPRAQTQAVHSNQKSVRLTLASDQSLKWDGTSITRTEFDQRLASASRSIPQPTIQLDADRAVSYESVAIVMATLKNAGITRVGLTLDPKAMP